MPTPPIDPTALVLVANDHYWPNLQGLLQWFANLHHIFIGWTEATRDAAKRLQAFCDDFVQTQRPALVVHRPERALQATPQDARKHVEAWRSECTGQRWLILDGGKDALYLSGLLPLALHPDVDLVSRNPAGQWFQLVPDTDGIGAEAVSVPDYVTDVIPISVILRHFWADGFSQSAAAFTTNALELTRKSVHYHGDWQRVAQDAGQPEMGLPFESYLAQALREMGAENLAVLQTKSGGANHAEQETEIVINRGGLRVIDGNLNRLEGMASHLRRLAQGLEARALFLWPTRSFPDEFRGLLPAYHLDLLESKHVGRFFERLAEFVGAAGLPPSLTDAEQVMADVANRGLHFFPSRRARPPQRAPRPERKPIAPRQDRAQATPRRQIPAPAPPPAPVIEPRDAAFDQSVQVKILGPFHLGNLRGYDVQEEGWPVGVLAWGAAPARKPRFGEFVTVYRENLDPKNPRYRWDRKP